MTAVPNFLAADISNYTGNIDVAFCDQLIAWKVYNLMVGTQDPVIARQQLGVSQRPEFNRDLYVQFDANQKVYQQFKPAVALAENNQIGTLWVACEQIAIPWKGTSDVYRALFDEALCVSAGLGFKSVGIYTSASQWAQLMGPDADYSAWKLWYANYDNIGQLTPAVWRTQGFGPWWKPTWKQYQQNYYINGHVVDFSVG